jgi:hypothetical protein
MVRDDARRAMLLELDRTITSLRTRLGDCAEIVSRTAQYHKLLRMWARPTRSTRSMGVRIRLTIERRARRAEIARHPEIDNLF